MTHDLHAAKHPPVSATVMAAPQAACDFDYFEQRIADVWLLEKSVAVRTLRMPFLAVPIGGSRRGGYFPVSCLCFGLKVRDVLLERPASPTCACGGRPTRTPAPSSRGARGRRRSGVTAMTSPSCASTATAQMR